MPLGANRLAAPLVAFLLASALMCGAGAAGSPGERSSHPPKVIQLSYDESNDGSSPRRVLQAFVRYSTDSVDFATRYHGHMATGDARYRPNITDTDIHGERARHPWALIRKHGGKRVLRLVHEALHQRGVAKVRTRARHGALRDVVRTRIVLSRCSQDPPFYPVSCEVRP
ncbi:MAG TPA: hypothetical protein VKG89_05940 [Solirubrobacterales bacterium]|nr:hypothetical protein [Solirubrobacterales bacterium]